MNLVLKSAALSCIFAISVHAADTTKVVTDSVSVKDTSKNYSNISAFGEYSFKSAPTPLKDEWKNGIGGGIGYEIYDKSRLSAVGTLGFRVFSFDEDEFMDSMKDSLNTSELKIDVSPLIMLDASVGVKFKARTEGFTPYAAAGLGYLLVFGGNGTVSYRGFDLDVPAVDADAVTLRASAGFQYQKSQKVGFYGQGSAVFGFSLGGDNYGYYPMEVGVMIPFKI